MDTSYLQQIKQRYGIVGNAEGLNRALDIAVQVASTDLSVLIVGESGVGKEVLPRIIHDRSTRKHNKYFAINCGSIPEGTIDSELFGHAKGAFTGAIGEREGYFGAANGGTLFLDEVGELPLATQARLLRVLETGEYIRVGENEIKKTDVRIVAATNVNMQKAIREGRFREDLYYRLNAIPISLPPLRERGRDIEMLFRKFAYEITEKYRMDEIRLTPDARDLLLKYKWPGNIRQLRNLTEQICVISREREITADTLRLYGITDDTVGGGLISASTSGSGETHSYENDRKQILQLITSLGKELQELKDYVYGAQQIPPSLPASTGVIQHINADGTVQHINMPSAYPKSSMEAAPIQEYVEQQAVPVQEEEQSLSIRDMEHINIEKALIKNHGNRKKAAQELGISDRTLYRKIKKLGIDN
ncbi:MAG: sigma-54-dependent Fis family transcriptional regulator [Bacteroidaceae bacterium]|nr:sigma-54-dependent Fis family transcriptional regulator [Bacteroidaceae bacterium]